jgi:hypothetical protein
MNLLKFDATSICVLSASSVPKWVGDLRCFATGTSATIGYQQPPVSPNIRPTQQSSASSTFLPRTSPPPWRAASLNLLKKCRYHSYRRLRHVKTYFIPQDHHRIVLDIDAGRNKGHQRGITTKQKFKTWGLRRRRTRYNQQLHINFSTWRQHHPRHWGQGVTSRPWADELQPDRPYDDHLRAQG